MNFTERKESCPVWELLPEDGRRMSSRVIMQTLGISSERTLFKQVQRERLAGLPILGFRDSAGGFSRAVDRSEVLRMYKRCRRTAGIEFQKMKRLRTILKTIPGQQGFDMSK